MVIRSDNGLPAEVADGFATISDEDCEALMSELRLTPLQGAIGVAARGFIVMIFRRVKRPAMIKFRGWPVEYRIGGGMPRAL